MNKGKCLQQRLTADLCNKCLHNAALVWHVLHHGHHRVVPSPYNGWAKNDGQVTHFHLHTTERRNQNMNFGKQRGIRGGQGKFPALINQIIMFSVNLRGKPKSVLATPGRGTIQERYRAVFPYGTACYANKWRKILRLGVKSSTMTTQIICCLLCWARQF